MKCSICGYDQCRCVKITLLPEAVSVQYHLCGTHKLEVELNYGYEDKTAVAAALRQAADKLEA